MYYRYHVKGEARREKIAGVQKPKRRSGRKALGLKPKGNKKGGK